MTQDLRPRFFGLYRGKAVNVSDPLQKGRVKALVPQVLGANITGWIEPCFPVVLNANHGDLGSNDPITTSEDGPSSHTHTVTLYPHAKLPDIGQGIWVMFEAGDPDYPVWIGVSS